MKQSVCVELVDKARCGLAKSGSEFPFGKIAIWKSTPAGSRLRSGYEREGQWRRGRRSLKVPGRRHSRLGPSGTMGRNKGLCSSYSSYGHPSLLRNVAHAPA